MNLSLEKLRRLAMLLGWAAILVITVATLSPIEARPHAPMLGADAERFLSYFAASAALAFAYPRGRWLVLAGIIAFAIGLEWLQTWEATRHGLPHDAMVKVAGALSGSCFSVWFDLMTQRFRKPA
ncbi:MAG: VanZ family protein [Bosea sp.]|uniref:VanZ family protein n=1 Tax=Bosea sp. (in: a-proteobacteria) TaxID=1871050 RepID=UPI001AC78718|nr:VanZ family protein [Bosea sp. (in: a-proteobacteria)]MBN9453564.1 VanZ family protein [Bosea sp. (in: a-proteobacteria)]